MSHKLSLREQLIALHSEVGFKVHHPLLRPVSSPTTYTVPPGGSQGCGSQYLQCLIPVVFLFILLAPTQQHTGDDRCSYLYV